MNNEHQIFDTPMPENRNFHRLKSKGIAYVQKLSGSMWTNFNDSDPGVTILDQLCYALTELGYCTNFPIEDILCQTDGEIKFKDQFYLPDEILTCSPVSINDYRKLIIDAEPLVRNVYIEKESSVSAVNGCYRVFLYVDSQSINEQAQVAKDTEPLTSKLVRQRVNILLNRHRNLGELFHPTVVLTPKIIQLKGTILLDDKASRNEVMSRIQLAMDLYVSPPVRKYGYQEMQALGLDSDEIFNGPRLKNGWIPAAELTPGKTNSVRLSDLAGIIAPIQGVKSVSKLQLHVPSDHGIAIENEEIAIGINEIGQIELALAFDGNAPEEGGLNPSQQLNLELLRLQHRHQGAKIGASVDLTPRLPQGRYRDISSYYSIQNTFPTLYAIGAESLPIDSPNYRVAQSRQLKGYLMVFDQLLANQFSQLANVQAIFSFKGTSTIAPFQGEAYDNIPYQLFPPTYFCQPLYQIPDVKPLLKGHDCYRFSAQPSTGMAEEEQMWQRYQADPFNQYIQGLRQNMENDAQRDDRRNRMLDHLLARHGEPAALYDELISTARWYGSTLKTRIIIKSILLQNLSSFSYNRTKAHNLLQCVKLGTPGRYRLTAEGFHLNADFDKAARALYRFADLGFYSRDALLNAIRKSRKLQCLQASWDKDKIKEFEKTCLVIKDGNATQHSDEYQLISDGQLDLQKLDALEQLHEQDFNNFSTIELQINLLLGLRQHYQLLAGTLLSLINSEQFKDWLNGSGSTRHFTLNDSDISVHVERDNDADHILFSGQHLLRIKSTGNKAPPTLTSYQAHLEQIQWLATQRKGFLLIETILLLEGGGFSREDLEKLDITAEQFSLGTLLVFPDYVSLFGPATFKQNLEMLAGVFCPIHVTNNVIPASFTILKRVIPAFIQWRNKLRYPDATSQQTVRVSQGGKIAPAATLTELLLVPLLRTS
jgi:hypothetical protein